LVSFSEILVSAIANNLFFAPSRKVLKCREDREERENSSQKSAFFSCRKKICTKMSHVVENGLILFSLENVGSVNIFGIWFKKLYFVYYD